MSAYMFANHDRPAIKAAVELLEKATQQAKVACERINVSTTAVDKLAGVAHELDAVLARNIDRPEFEVPPALAPGLRVAFGLELEKLVKISKGQMELGIDPDDTADRTQHVERLIGVLDGAMALGPA